MRWSQICLRIMLWSLAMSAAVGVGSVFTSHHQVLVRLLGTTFGTSVAAGLLWPLTRLAERPETREAGLVGMGTVLLDFILLLVLIWGDYLLSESFYISESLWFTVLWVLTCGGAAVILLRFLHHPYGRTAALVGVGVCALGFVELMIASWMQQGRFGLPNEHWFSVAAFTGLFGFLMVGGLVGPLARHPWRWLGVAASAIAWALATLHQFHETKSPTGEILFALLTSVAAIVAYTNLMLLPSLAPIQEVVRRGTIILAFVTALLVDWLIINGILQSPGGFGYSEFDDMLTRLAGASGILTACGTVAIFVLSVIHRSAKVKPRPKTPWNEITIVCPSCGLEQKVMLGESVCARCHLTFFIRIGERRDK
ncbi:MAG: hypothetical protein HY040_12600 [Planctomycetes bacterium]|nr:hypothetical protein [Planctomycetota bacterium]